jgi:hypothetical protein
MNKLKIEAFSKPDCQSGSLGSIEAIINPENYSYTKNVEYSNSNEQGSNANTALFSKIGPSDLKFKLIVDGTGIVSLGSYANVDAYIKSFNDLLYRYNGDIHRPNYLQLSWNGIIAVAVLKSYTVTYTLFNTDGTALRANIDASFTESIDFKTKAKMAGKNSPDMSHIRVVKAGDTLPLMSYRIYGDSSWYLEIARVNNIDDFRSIQPGQKILFPPLAR